MQTTNIIHFPGLPLFRLEYKFTQFILVPGPSSRWRWHHRHLAGPARSGRPGRSVSVRSVSVRSGPGGGGWCTPRPVRKPLRILVCVECTGYSRWHAASTAGLNQKSWNFLFWIYFMVAFQGKIHFFFLPCGAFEHCHCSKRHIFHIISPPSPMCVHLPTYVIY
jgi:hypothetical protein